MGAAERDEFLRAAWRALVAGEVDAERLVFVDEMGANVSLVSLYAWSRRGQRAFGCAPRNWGKNVISAHKGGRVREIVEGAGCELLYLPPYSPDLNPIEQAFAKVKGLLRKAEARTRGALVEAMGRALDAVTEQDARGFFGHCGYRAVDQPL